MSDHLPSRAAPRPVAPGWMVTAGALVLVWLSGRLPLPGLDPNAFARPQKAAELLTIFGLGVTPILIGWFVVEFARLAVPALARARPGLLELAASAIAIALAGVQARGIAVAVQAGPSFVDPSSTFVAEVVASMVGATSFLLWTARVIDRRGVGDGLLLLFAGQALARVAWQARRVFEQARPGRADLSAAWPWVAAVVVGGLLAGFAARGKNGWRGIDP